MRQSHPRSLRDQATFLRRQFLQDGELSFTNVLTEDIIAQALATLGGWLDRIFSPWSPCGSSSGRFSAPTTRAGPPSPA